MDHATPEHAFDRRWALTLLASVLADLGAEYQRRGRGELFGKLQRFLEAGSDDPDYPQLAIDLGLTPGAVKVTVHRMRRRYRELLVAEVRQTLAEPEDAIDEIGALLDAVGPAGPPGR